MNVALPTTIELCAGYGGIGLGLTLAIGELRPLVYVEREISVARKLVARFQDGTLAPADIWSDLKTFDGRRYRGEVDILTAGYPCQPFSCAGKQLGKEDPRHLWPHVARIIREVEPRQVFLENVDAHLRLGFDEVASELEGMGYRVACGLFSAEEVGMPHRRLRLFALAERLEVPQHTGHRPHVATGDTSEADGRGKTRGVPKPAGRPQLSGATVALRKSGRRGELRQSPGSEGLVDGRGEAVEDAARLPEHRQVGEDVGRRRGIQQAGNELALAERLDREGEAAASRCKRARPRAAAPGSGGTLADTERTNGRADHQRGSRQENENAGAPSRDGEDLADHSGPRLSIRRRNEEAEGPRAWAGGGGIPIFPPGPADLEAWSRLLMQRPDVEPALCRASYERADRMDGRRSSSRTSRLRALGNGVAPLTAALAYSTLRADLDGESGLTILQ